MAKSTFTVNIVFAILLSIIVIIQSQEQENMTPKVANNNAAHMNSTITTTAAEIENKKVMINATKYNCDGENIVNQKATITISELEHLNKKYNEFLQKINTSNQNPLMKLKKMKNETFLNEIENIQSRVTNIKNEWNDIRMKPETESVIKFKLMQICMKIVMSSLIFPDIYSEIEEKFNALHGLFNKTPVDLEISFKKMEIALQEFVMSNQLENFDRNAGILDSVFQQNMRSDSKVQMKYRKIIYFIKKLLDENPLIDKGVCIINLKRMINKMESLIDGCIETRKSVHDELWHLYVEYDPLIEKAEKLFVTMDETKKLIEGHEKFISFIKEVYSASDVATTPMFRVRYEKAHFAKQLKELEETTKSEINNYRFIFPELRLAKGELASLAIEKNAHEHMLYKERDYPRKKYSATQTDMLKNAKNKVDDVNRVVEKGATTLDSIENPIDVLVLRVRVNEDEHMQNLNNIILFIHLLQDCDDESIIVKGKKEKMNHRICMEKLLELLNKEKEWSKTYGLSTENEKENIMEKILRFNEEIKDIRNRIEEAKEKLKEANMLLQKSKNNRCGST